MLKHPIETFKTLIKPLGNGIGLVGSVIFNLAKYVGVPLTKEWIEMLVKHGPTIL